VTRALIWALHFKLFMRSEAPEKAQNRIDDFWRESVSLADADAEEDDAGYHHSGGRRGRLRRSEEGGQAGDGEYEEEVREGVVCILEANVS